MEDAKSFHNKKMKIGAMLPEPTSDEELRNILLDHLLGEDTVISNNLPRKIENTIAIQYILQSLPYKIAKDDSTIWIPVNAKMLILSIPCIIIGILIFLFVG